MERLNCSVPVPDRFRGGVIALGNFDGFHKGHQAVVGEALTLARKCGVPALIATFDPHPVSYFRPGTPPFRLTTLDQRATLFKDAGAEAMLVFQFDAALASLSAADFADRFLRGFSGVVTGEDFTFGKGRDGNISALSALGREMGFDATAVSPVRDDVARDDLSNGEGVISSSRIRAALQQGDCATATGLLSRPFTVQGVVQHGDKNGRKLGFPTANVDMADYVRPRYGIYAVRGRLADGRILDGAANIGIRPQFDPPKELLEPHFFDFAEDLYGQTIEVEFHHFLRGEAKFDSLDDLIEQMDKDCAQARKLLSAP
jgi:riboflavin kinase / FMN adenylyltransferase